jgi:hypothetical protein
VNSYQVLQQVVAGLKYKPGWQFGLRYGVTSGTQFFTPWSRAATGNVSTAVTVIPDGEPVFLVIVVTARDSSAPERWIQVQHEFAAPHHMFAGEWDEFVLICILKVEAHEAMECFEVGGVKTFYPGHGPDGNLYGVKRKAPLPFPVLTEAS